MNYFIGLGLLDKDLTIFGEGNQLRNVNYVDDAATALILAANREESNGQVLFAVADTHYDIAEIARQITEHIGGRVRFVPWPEDRKAIEIGDAVISDHKIKSVLNWVRCFDLKSGLIRTKDYFAPCLEQYLT